MTEMITIRSMRETDWPSVADIYQQGISTNLATFQRDCPTYEEWDRAHLKTCRLVILKDEGVVGWATLAAVSSRCVYAGVAEVSIYLHNDYHGHGLGAQLLNALIAASEREGFWTLQSGIMQNNTASIRLHEKCGFRLVGYRERIARDHLGAWRNTVLMERRSSKEGTEET